MEKTFEAVYEDGMLRPLEDLHLPNHRRVRLIMVSSPAEQGLADYFSPEEWAAATEDTVTLEDVRQALSSIPGCLSDTVVASREER